jgi:glycerophosphoryl diester phosphodiesterase
MQVRLKNTLAGLLLLLIVCPAISAKTPQTKVIAHRGYWNCEGSAQNSITSLQKAQEIEIYGSEFDVWLTSDGILVVNHDGIIESLKIEDTPYTQLKDIRLKNGEKLSTLESYLLEGKKNKKTKLILEIKPHSTKEREDKTTADVLKIVEKLGLKKQVEYISFSLNVCKELVRLQPKAKVAYLSGNLSPKELKALGINGMDYHFDALNKNKQWIAEAHQLKMTVNVWTVNDKSLMREMAVAGVDYITTDNPLDAKQVCNTIYNTGGVAGY